VRLVKCTPSSLELVLPESHVRHARVGDVIVASHFLHNCEHLMDVDENSQEKKDGEPVNNNMYHRVTKVVSTDWHNDDGSMAAGSSQGKVAHVKLWTKEMLSLADAIGSVAYNFGYVPPEAVDTRQYPERRTWDSDYQRGKWIDRSERRLNEQTGTPETFNANDFTRPTDTFQGANVGNANSDIQYRVDGGKPVLGGEMVTSDDVKSLLNMQPKKVANFGWNWDFKLNASQDISFNYSTPGNRMYFVIAKPYVKAHSVIKFRFRSYMPNENAEDTFFTDNTWVSLKKHQSDKVADVFEHWTPRVKWEFTMDGHATIAGSLMSQMKFDMSVSSDPLELIQIPVLHDFWKPKWFGTVDFNLGDLPVSITPGLQFKAKFFHYGTFRGSLAIGLNAQPIFKPKLQFDSYTGLRIDLNTVMKEVTLTPPNYMVATSHFECGIALEPTIWVKGHLGDMGDTGFKGKGGIHALINSVQAGHRRLLNGTWGNGHGNLHRLADTKVAAALRPYFNMTIERKGHKVGTPGDEQRDLTIYPFRIVGLPVDTNKRYKVRIQTSMPAQFCTPNTNNLRSSNGQPINALTPNSAGYSANGNSKPNCDLFIRRMETTEGLNWGEVEYHDPVQKFNWGIISQRMVMNLIIKVDLVEVNYVTGKPVERVSATKSINTRTIINGIVQPSPEEITLPFENTNVKVYLHTLWKKNPTPWFATRLKGVAISFPEVIVNKDYIQQVVPDFAIDSYANTGAVTGTGATKPLVLVLRHAAKSFPILIDQHNGYVPGINSSSLKSDQILEIGASFLSSWDRTCISATTQCDPEIILYHGDTPISKAVLPVIPWNTQTEMVRNIGSVIGAPAHSSHVVPVTVALKPISLPNGNFPNWGRVGLVRMKFAISSPTSWNRFVSPYEYTPVPAGSSYKLVWTIHSVPQQEATKFTITLRKGVKRTSTTASVNASYATTSQYLRPQLGAGDNSFTAGTHLFFDQVSSTVVSLMPYSDTTGGVIKTRFTHDIAFTGGAVGETMMVSIKWTDKLGNTHRMYASPFLMESTTTSQASADAVALVNANTGMNTSRRLATDPFKQFGDQLKQIVGGDDYGWKRGKDGTWSHKHYGADRTTNQECTQKDLNFAFGAGLMFRAFAKGLSFPSDIPILGAINNAPEIGTPWQTITGWKSNYADLATKLPALLCRHGACSATLPGCAQYSDVKHYYPEITIQFRHTIKYPHGPDMSRWQATLKDALSYVFAVLPEAITIMEHYLNQTVVPGTLNPTTASGTAAAHRRRYQQYHNVMMGTDACENRAYDATACGEVGCCQYDTTTDECHSAVGTGPCYKNGVAVSANLLNPAALNAQVMTAGAKTPTGTAAASAVSNHLGVNASTANAILNHLAANPQHVSAILNGINSLTPAPGNIPATVLPPTVAPGPVITPLLPIGTGGRRLQTETRVHSMTVSFKDGLRYEVDHKLINEMLSQGLFKQFEDVETGDDKPIRIHSYAVRNLSPAGPKEDSLPSMSQKDSLPKDIKTGAVAQSLQTPLLAALACCTLLGVTLVLRRSRNSYLQVEESSEPVE